MFLILYIILAYNWATYLVFRNRYTVFKKGLFGFIGALITRFFWMLPFTFLMVIAFFVDFSYMDKIDAFIQLFTTKFSFLQIWLYANAYFCLVFPIIYHKKYSSDLAKKVDTYLGKQPSAKKQTKIAHNTQSSQMPAYKPTERLEKLKELEQQFLKLLSIKTTEKNKLELEKIRLDIKSEELKCRINAL